MSYKLGKRSLSELACVHPLLGFAVIKAIEITRQDFMVFDGVRTTKEQEKLVLRGVSKTNNSYHLYGLAVDLVAYVDGKPSWDKEHYQAIVEAMKHIIEKYELPIEWGYDKWGWDLPHWQITKLDGKDARQVYDVRQLKGE